MSLTGSTRFIHIFSRVLILLFAVAVIILLIVPWRQFVKGTGKVIAFDPLDRQVSVEAQVSGRIKVLSVVEGQKVKKGEVIAEIEDNDPNLLQNLESQRIAAESKIEFAKSKVEAYLSEIEQLELGKVQAIEVAEQKIEVADVKAKTAQLEFDRIMALFEKGLASRRDKEQTTLKRDTSAAELLSARASLGKTATEFDSKISSKRTSLESAKGEVALAEKGLADAVSKVSKSDRQTILAPRDGVVLQVPVTEGSYLKPGSPICSIVPETDERFVEVWVDGNDVALIEPRKEENGVVTAGSPVRLAFEGWPAMQVVGWPQRAVGTFGGEVMFIDATDDGEGRFRVVIAPTVDKVDRGDGKGVVDSSWPTDGERWLRQGVATKAWIMLDEVPLWFELWRQLNGFPAVGDGLKEEKPEKKTKLK